MPGTTKMSKVSKFFRIGVEGATTDGRKISRLHIEQMAKNFNPALYGCRINLEHFRGIFPDGPFKRYGDVIALKAEEITDGPLKGKMALLAQISPTDDLVEFSRLKQKIYTSMEVDESFADTGEAYLVGLAVTDDPASLGTEILEFSSKATVKLFASRKESPDNLFTAAELAELEFIDTPEPEQNAFFSRIKNLLSSKAAADHSRFNDIHQAVELLTEHQRNSSIQYADLSQKYQQLNTSHTELQNDLTAFKLELSQQDRSINNRSPATGGDSNMLTDC